LDSTSEKGDEERGTSTAWSVYVRAQRFDPCFLGDLPDSEEKDSIWAMYRHQFGIPDSQPRGHRAAHDAAWLEELPLL
jgi:hypothetical protein